MWGDFMNSIWNSDVQLPAFEPLRESIKADVLIIGGGIAGLLCAYVLKEAGVNDVVLVEAKRICGGVTGKTTAKITLQHGLIYDKLLRRFGAEKAKLYLQCNQEALLRYKALAQIIPCDYSAQDAFVYAQNNLKSLELELAALDKLGYAADLVEDLALPFPVVGGLRLPGQAQFHPLRFLSGVAKNLRIYENTKVQELKPGIATANNTTIQAENIIVATHFPMLNKHGSYFLKLYQHRSYVMALENAEIPNGMYLGAEYPNLSLRKYGEALLLGGCGDRTGKTGGWQELSYYAHRYFPKSKCVCRWATQDCIPLDGMPYIGQYSPNTPGLYVATGFQKWGMTTAMAAAGILSDLIVGKETPYANLFSPSRTILHPQLAWNCLETLKNWITFRKPRCPHMGCALHWNREEHSWDCSCHGSRFSESGEVLDNPASADMKKSPSTYKKH